MANTEIKSDPVVVNRSVGKVYDFLHDLTNYKSLMPPEVVAFDAQPEKANINLKGLGAFAITRGKCITNEQIVLNPSGKLPFDFDINWSLSEQNGSTVIVGRINAQLNMFMKMMAEAKLKDFVSSQASKMKAHLENGIPSE